MRRAPKYVHGFIDRHGKPRFYFRRRHGLRKAAARRLAEAGCTEHGIGAITGHASLRGDRSLYQGGRSKAIRGDGKGQSQYIEWPTYRIVSQKEEKGVKHQSAKEVLAPRAGFEPATQRLTAACSTC
jgi:hypothetical protein